MKPVRLVLVHIICFYRCIPDVIEVLHVCVEVLSILFFFIVVVLVRMIFGRARFFRVLVVIVSPVVAVFRCVGLSFISIKIVFFLEDKDTTYVVLFFVLCKGSAYRYEEIISAVLNVNVLPACNGDYSQSQQLVQCEDLAYLIFELLVFITQVVHFFVKVSDRIQTRRSLPVSRQRQRVRLRWFRQQSREQRCAWYHGRSCNRHCLYPTLLELQTCRVAVICPPLMCRVT